MGRWARNAPDIFRNTAHRHNLIRGLEKPQPNTAVRRFAAATGFKCVFFRSDTFA